MFLRYLLAWLPMVVIGILNGALREMTFRKWMSEQRANQVSCVTGVVFLGLYIWFLANRWPLGSGLEALGLGLLWLALTVAFEFLFGHYVAGKAWTLLFRDYNLRAGRLWSLVLLWVMIAPFIFYRLHQTP